MVERRVFLAAAAAVLSAVTNPDLGVLVPAGALVPEPGSTHGVSFDPAALHLMDEGA